MASQKGMFAGVLLCLVVSMTLALQVSIPEPSYEFARGDNITLPCSFKPKNPINNLVIISWLAEADKPGEPEESILTFYSTDELDISDRYEGRVSLEQDMAKGVANLKLSSIGLQDNRLFECRVSIPKDDKGQLADTTRLVVLVAPSVPICKIDGRAEYFQNISLTCLSEEGSPLPTYKWQGYDVKNMPRAPAPRTTDKDGVLSLFNLTMESSGYYVCTSTNKIRSAKCNLTLSVMPPSMTLGSTAGIIGGVVVGVLVLLIILIYCCCCRKKKDKAEEYAMGVPEGEEFHDDKPVVNGEVRQTRSEEGDDEDHPPKIVDRRDQYKERSEKDTMTAAATTMTAAATTMTAAATTMTAAATTVTAASAMMTAGTRTTATLTGTIVIVFTMNAATADGTVIVMMSPTMSVTDLPVYRPINLLSLLTNRID
ncbi:glycoprotein A33 (transmembrane), paralog a isoform 2-T2 [Salvelinus alpinus]